MTSTGRWSFSTAFLLASGCVAVFYGAQIAYTQHALLSWPTTEATVVDFKPNWKNADGGYAHPAVTFRYSHDNQTYVGDWLNPSPFNYQDYQQFKAETGKFHPGAKVTCWYNPRRPSEAYLVNVGVTQAGVLVMLFGLALWSMVVRKLLHDRRLAASA